MKIVNIILIALAVLVSSNVYAGDMSYLDRIGFEESFKESCIEGFKEQNYGFEMWQQESFCDCAAMFTGEKISNDDIAYFIKNKRYPKSMLDKRDKASTQCMKELMKSWGYPQ